MPEEQPPMPAAEQPPEPQRTATPPSTTPQPPDRASFGAQLLLGFVAVLLLLVGITSLIVLIGLHPPGYVLGLVFPLIPIGLGVLVLVKRVKRGPGLWVGFLIGIGIPALALGVCAAMISTMRFH